MEGRKKLARWGIGVALAAVGFFAVPFVLPAAGAPAPTLLPAAAPSGWSSVAPFDFGGSGGQHELRDVSCPSITLCVGVDSNGDTVTSTDPTAATPTWSVHQIFDGYGLSGVSCPSTSLCVAAGGLPGDINITTDPADGASATWTTTNVPGTGLMGSVSCPSASLCMAIDSANVLTTADPSDPSPTWTVNNVEKASDPNAGTLAGISCPTATFCAAVDESGRVLISADPDAGSQANWVPINVVPSSDGFSSISCPSAGLCVAIDRQGDAITSTNPGLFGVAKWTFANIDAIGNHAGPISCASATLCVAGDGKGNILATNDPTDGSAAKWTLVNADPPNRVYGIGSPNGIPAISCDPTSTFCVAVDVNGHAVTSTNPTGDASAWSVTQADSAVDFQSNFPLAVSCGSNTFCAAVDGRGNILTTTDPADGTAASWNVVLSLDQDVFTAISCPSTSLCVAAESGGLVLSSTDPTAAAPKWTYSTATVVPVSFLNSLSCPSASLCVAAGDSGNIGVSTDPADPASWKSTNIDGNIALHGVSCSSNTFCAAVDDHGNILTSIDPSVGSSWAMTAVGVDNGAHLEAVSCASTSLCVALESWYGNDIVVSSDPRGDASDWTPIIANTGLMAVSCPSNSFCVAGGQGAANAGELFTSTNPTGYPSDWTATTIDSNDELRGVSCPSVGMCLAVGSAGYFTRALAEPSASTSAASSVTGTTATLNGVVEPNGWDVSGCRFDYGTSSGALDSSVPCDVSLPIPGKSADVSVSAGLTGLTPGTTYFFRLVATTSLGAKSGVVRQFTAGSATTTTTTTTTTTQAEPPALSGLGVAPSAFLAASSGPAIGGSSRGGRISYRDTQAAATRFVVQRHLTGLKKVGKCVAKPHRTTPGKLAACSRWVSVGSFSHRDAAGANHFHFNGRVGRRGLAPGRYRLRAVASLHGLKSNQVQARFRVKKP